MTGRGLGARQTADGGQGAVSLPGSKREPYPPGKPGGCRRGRPNAPGGASGPGQEHRWGGGAGRKHWQPHQRQQRPRPLEGDGGHPYPIRAFAAPAEYDGGSGRGVGVLLTGPPGNAGATSSTGGIAGDPNVASLPFTAGGATTCPHHQRSTARIKVRKGGGAGTGRQSLRRILQRAGHARQQAAPTPHGGGIGHNGRGGGTTGVDRTGGNHPGIPPLPKLNRCLPPRWNRGAQFGIAWKLTHDLTAGFEISL